MAWNAVRKVWPYHDNKTRERRPRHYAWGRLSDLPEMDIMRRPFRIVLVLLILTLALWATPLLAAESASGSGPALFAGLFDSFNNRSRMIQVSMVVVAIGCFVLMKR